MACSPRRDWPTGFLVAACLTGSAAPPAAAQEAPLVDRAVGDLDTLATSSRYLDPAYGNDLNRARLYQLRTADLQAGTRPQYRFEAPGFRATFDQPDYLTLSEDGVGLNRAPLYDGAFIELIPPNTVFDLTPSRPAAFGEPPSPESLRWRVDTRWDRDRAARPGPWGGDPWGREPVRHSFQQVPRGAEAPVPTPGEPVVLQPWVTARDLREHQAEVPLVTDRVVLPGELGTVNVEPDRAAQ